MDNIKNRTVIEITPYKTTENDTVIAYENKFEKWLTQSFIKSYIPDSTNRLSFSNNHLNTKNS